MTKPCQGPDPDPKPPRITPPPLSCDTHAHVFGPAEKYPYPATRGYTPPDCPVETYASVLNTLGIERSVIVHGGANGTNNLVTRDAIAFMGDNCRGIAVVDPDITDEELSDLDQVGFRGIRLSTHVKGGIGTDHLDAFAPRIRELGWHVLLHLDHADELIALAPKLKQLKIGVVVDHLARVRGSAGVQNEAFQCLLDLLVNTDFCWTKISSWYRLSDQTAPYGDMEPMAKALIEARVDRLLWGTNWPHPVYQGSMPNDGDLLDQFMEWAGDEKTWTKILVDNPAQLYGF